MSPSYPMHPEVARLEISQRLRAADDERRRRLARRGLGTARRRSQVRAGQLAWR